MHGGKARANHDNAKGSSCCSSGGGGLRCDKEGHGRREVNHDVDDECEHQVCHGERGLCDGERSLHKIQWSRRRGQRQSQEALRDGAASRQERF